MKPQRQEQTGLHLEVERGRIVAGMQMSDGWKLLEDELVKMLLSYRREAMSTKYFNDRVGYAALVGAHNAIQSLLDLLLDIRNRGEKAEARIAEADKQSREERELERSVRRI